MIKNANHNFASFRFRKWSRKSYAVFSGLGKQISIGFLQKEIADKSLKKQKPHSEKTFFLPVSIYADDSIPLSPFLWENQFEEQPVIFIIHLTKQASSASVSEQVYPIATINNQTEENIPRTGVFSFYFS